MITGVAVLGLLAGSLASFFRLDDNGTATGSVPADESASPQPAGEAALQALAAEVSALRRQVEALAVRLPAGPPGVAPPEPSAGGDGPD